MNLGRLILTAAGIVAVGSELSTLPQFGNDLTRACGDLFSSSSSRYYGGHTDECFSEKPITYEFCRMFLKESRTCSALTYADGNCWLHDRTKLDFDTSGGPMRYRNRRAITVIKYTDLDYCHRTGVNRSYISALQSFNQCMISSPNVSLTGLPTLALVISVTRGWAAKNKLELAAVSSNIKCYCDAHGYAFVSNLFVLIFLFTQLTLGSMCLAPSRYERYEQVQVFSLPPY